MFHCKLRTLLILLAVMPPMLSGTWLGYSRYLRYCDDLEQARIKAEREEIDLILQNILYGTSARTVWQGKLLDDSLRADNCQ